VGDRWRGRRGVLVPVQEGQHDQRDHCDADQRPWEAPLADRVREQREQGECPDTDERERAVAVVEVHGRPGLAVLGQQQPARDVQQDAGAAEEHQHHERHAQQHRVDVEVTGQAAGDTGELAVGSDGAPDPAQLADLVAADAGSLVGRGRRPARSLVRSGGHGTRLRAPQAAHHRGRP
jgi:hypothetical protein